MEKVYKLGRGSWKSIDEGNELSWMIGNGIGGYANHTVAGGGAMSFHGYLVASFNPPVSRFLVFTRTQEEINISGRSYDLTSQQYINENKNGQEYLERFIFESVPEYYYRVEDILIKKSIAMEYGHNTVVVCYEVENGVEEVNFKIVPLFNYRIAGEVSEKSELKFNIDLNVMTNTLKLTPKGNKDTSIYFEASEGKFLDRSLKETSMATPNYLIEENHFYKIDNRTGFLGIDNHYTPYEINIKLKAKEKKKFYVRCSTEGFSKDGYIKEDNIYGNIKRTTWIKEGESSSTISINNKNRGHKIKSGFEILKEYKERSEGLVSNAGYNNNFINNLVKASDHFVVKRKSTGLKTILAGFPWFTDWGRDTMIAFEGLVLVTKRFDDAREILQSFSKYVRNGLVPNVFPDANVEPGYNTVDASLWYFQAVNEYLNYTGKDEDYKFIKQNIYPKLKEIYYAYSTSTDFSIGMDKDGLIFAGGGLDQVTWMDVRVGELVVTPRHGKPVEINALWYNALKILQKLSEKYGEENKVYNELAEKVKKSFNEKFWNEENNCLYDVVDKKDSSIRPNQIWAVSLPYTMLDEAKEKAIVDTVYKHLYSTYGLKSLSFMDKRYKNKYIGKLINRDLSYHMGTTWGFLIGPFITAYCKVNKHSKESVERAKYMCEVFEDHLKDGCINGIAEIFDGDFSATTRGCYSQAWSVGEVLRAYVKDVYLYSENS